MDITYDDIKRFINKYFGTKKQQVRALSSVLAILLVILGSTFAYNKINQPKEDKPEIVDKEDEESNDISDDTANTPNPPTVIKPEEQPDQPQEKPVKKPKEDLITYGAPYEESLDIDFIEVREDDPDLEVGTEEKNLELELKVWKLEKFELSTSMVFK